MSNHTIMTPRRRRYMSDLSPAETAIARVRAAAEKSTREVESAAAARAEARDRLRKSGALNGPRNHG